MFEGKERRKELIQELRHTHALQSPEQKIKKEEERQILAEQAAHKRQQHKVWDKLNSDKWIIDKNYQNPISFLVHFSHWCVFPQTITIFKQLNACF